MLFLSFFRVSGHSMEPTYKDGETLLVSALPYVFRKPRVNDIVVLKHNALEKVKRIAKVKDDKVFVVGDNPTKSTDSRHFGWVSKKEILGKVIYKI